MGQWRHAPCWPDSQRPRDPQPVTGSTLSQTPNSQTRIGPSTITGAETPKLRLVYDGPKFIQRK
jgi:hypothetical protein